MNKTRKLAYLAAAGNALIWGAALPLVKPALSYITPHQFLFLRFMIAAPLLLPFLIKGVSKIPLKTLFKIIGIEVISMTVLYLIYTGLDNTSALQASFLLNTKPIFATLAGIFLLHEIEERHELLGLVIAVIGTVLVISTPLFYGSDTLGSEFSILGNAIILSALIIDVFRLMGVSKIYAKIDKLTVVSISTMIGLVYFFIINYFSGSLPNLSLITTPSVALPVIYMGTLGTIVAFGLQFYAYTKIETSEAALFTYLQPLVYIPLSIFLLKDILLPTQLFGVIIIAIGVFIAEKRSKESPRIKSLRQ